MNALGLSAAQLAERKLHLHAGDASDLMEGRWQKVWARFQPGYVEEDLSGEFRVQLGSYTEPFGLWWTEKQTGRAVEYFSDNPLARHVWKTLTGRDARSELVVSQDYPWMAVNLDALSTTPQGHRCVLDAKHMGRAGEAEILRYTAAGTFQATVLGTDWWGIAPIVGNKWEPPILQEIDVLYQARLIATTREFWTFVERNEEPEDRTEPKPPPKPQPKRREVALPAQQADANWSGDFMRLARDFAGTHDAAVRHAITREEIKALVPDDVGKVTFGLVRYGRDGRGQTIALDKPEETGK